VRIGSKIQTGDHRATLVRMQGHFKPKLPTHGQHRLILRQNRTFNAAESVSPAVVNELPEQRPSDALTLQVGTNQKGESPGTRLRSAE